MRDLSLTAAHPRTRERFLALCEICLGKSATRVGRETQRNPQTIVDWVHRYNHSGPNTLTFRHTGGHPPPFVCTGRRRVKAKNSRGIDHSGDSTATAIATGRLLVYIDEAHMDLAPDQCL